MNARLRPLRQACAFACVALAPTPVLAQTSPIGDLLGRAHGALNALRYGEADSLARAVLTTFTTRMSREQRTEALSIAAAAVYPDPAGGGVQRRDSALAYLRQLVRSDPAGRIRPDVSWIGLDSLFAQAQRMTFAAFARPQSQYVLTGAGSEASVEVQATRTAMFRLALRASAGGPAILLDSSGPGMRATLRLVLLRTEQPLVRSGSYQLELSASDAASPEIITMRYAVTIDAPPLVFAAPPTFDSSQLRPERAPPARSRGIVAGLVLGAGTAAAVVLHGPAPLSQAQADSRGFAMGAGIALGAIAGGLLDRGHALPGNVAANAALRAAFEASRVRALAERRARIDAYRATVSIQLEN